MIPNEIFFLTWRGDDPFFFPQTGLMGVVEKTGNRASLFLLLKNGEL